MPHSEQSMEATQAIQIAEKYFPADLGRQMSLAKDILDAINLCESDMAMEIVGRIHQKRPHSEQQREGTGERK